MRRFITFFLGIIGILASFADGLHEIRSKGLSAKGIIKHYNYTDFSREKHYFRNDFIYPDPVKQKDWTQRETYLDQGKSEP